MSAPQLSPSLFLFLFLSPFIFLILCLSLSYVNTSLGHHSGPYFEYWICSILQSSKSIVIFIKSIRIVLQKLGVTFLIQKKLTHSGKVEALQLISSAYQPHKTKLPLSFYPPSPTMSLCPLTPLRPSPGPLACLLPPSSR